jgi:hypothetical protein
VALRNSPNWALLAISIAGIALTSYLTIKAWSGGAAARHELLEVGDCRD